MFFLRRQIHKIFIASSDSKVKELGILQCAGAYLAEDGVDFHIYFRSLSVTFQLYDFLVLVSKFKFTSKKENKKRKFDKQVSTFYSVKKKIKK